MAEKYGFDISKPASNAKEAIQWLYFGYLGAVKDQNGAAMSLGRTSTFLDVYIEKDLENGVITEEEAQELMDHFVMKLRLVRFLRAPEYNELFSGDPVWVTESIGGMGVDGRTLVTKNSFRVLHTLRTLGPAPEPNLTVLWSKNLPQGFKDFCAKISIDTSAIQYENDDLMRVTLGDDYGIACCVSAMKIGKQMQFFGARANLAKTLLYAINGGRDEISGKQIGPKFRPITSEYLDYDEVMEKFDDMMEYVAKIYIKALNAIHYMHDKYSYEALEMALHDKEILRTMACGIAGLSVVADSLSAIKYAKVKVIRNEDGLAVDYAVEGDYPKYGNDDDYVDQLIVEAYDSYIEEIEKYPNTRYNRGPIGGIRYAGTSSISANVGQGMSTMATPDGRNAFEPLAEGCSPAHNSDKNGPTAVFKSVSKLRTNKITGGVLLNQKMTPQMLSTEENRQKLELLIKTFFNRLHGYHVQYNIVSKETLIDAQKHPENHKDLIVRVAGYSAFFNVLSKKTQDDIIGRTEQSLM